MIKVPIGRGATLQPQRIKQPESLATTDLEFTQKLADEGKTLAITETFTGNSAQLLSFTPPNGSTFYLICGKAHDSQTAVAWNLSINGVLFESFRFDGGVSQTIETKLSVVFPDTFTIDIVSSTGGIHRVNLFGYLEPTETTSSRGTTSVN